MESYRDRNIQLAVHNLDDHIHEVQPNKSAERTILGFTRSAGHCTMRRSSGHHSTSVSYWAKSAAEFLRSISVDVRHWKP